jgi:hypothetical protein
MSGYALLLTLGWCAGMIAVMTVVLKIATRVTPLRMGARWIAFWVVVIIGFGLVVTGAVGMFGYPIELGLEGELALPFALVFVAGLPWAPLALFSLVVIPFREQRKAGVRFDDTVQGDE